MQRVLTFLRVHRRSAILVLGVLLLAGIIRGFGHRGAPALLSFWWIVGILSPVILAGIVSTYRSAAGGTTISTRWALWASIGIFAYHILHWAWAYPHWLVATAGWPWFTAVGLIAVTFVAVVLAILWVVFRQKYLQAAGVFAAIMLVWTATHQFVGQSIRYDVRDGDQIIKWCQIDGEAFYGERLDFKACPQHGEGVFTKDFEKVEVWYCPTDNTTYLGKLWAGRSVPRGDERILLERATPVIRRQLENMGAIVHMAAGHAGDVNPQNFNPKQKSAWANLMGWTVVTLGVFGVGWGLLVFLTAKRGGSHHA